MLDIIKCAIKNLGRKKVRTVLTILGIAVGVSSVILVNNIGKMGSSAVSGELDSLGLSGLSISTSTLRQTPATLTQEELEVIKNTNHVKNAVPIVIEHTEAYSRNEQISTLLWGIDSSASQVISLKILHGRNINSSDVNSASNVCVVDQSFSRLAYNRDNIVGKKIPIRCGVDIEDYEVVGVIKTGSGLLQNMMGDYIPNFIYVPYTRIQESFGKQNFDQIAVKIDDSNNVEKTGDVIVRKLLNIKGIDEGYYANDFSKQKQGLSNLLNIVTIILSLIGAISLVVASLSIMTVMLVSVSERTREIGIKKSIGAKRRTIMFEFLVEAVLLSLIGFIMGTVVGTILSYAGALYSGVDLNMGWGIIAVAFLFSMFTGVAFGLYPAAKASNLKPVDALKVSF